MADSDAEAGKQREQPGRKDPVIELLFFHPPALTKTPLVSLQGG
jgi:hypothetical protein